MAIHQNCDGLFRRDFLQLGLRGAMGLGLCDLLRLKAQASGQPGVTAKNITCIMIWLDGGPSHFETFDPKPDAPADIRGVFKTVPTSVPGVHFSEPVSKLAGVPYRCLEEDASTFSLMAAPIGEPSRGTGLR